MTESSQAKHLVRHSILVGIQLDDVAYRHLLDSYVGDLGERFLDEDVIGLSPNEILDDVIPRLDPVASARSGGAVFEALDQFCREKWRLDLALTASDFGTREKRDGPYRFDRAQYHLGRRIVVGRVESPFPSACPYRRSRHLELDWAREHQSKWHELLPDSLWWALNEAPDELSKSLGEQAVEDLSERLEEAGFTTGSMGLYMATLETVHDAGEALPR